jgi:hypothetical protein
MWRWFGFTLCAAIELYTRKITSQVKANIISCIIFQIYFIINTSLLILDTQQNYQNYQKTLDLLYGYFVYDTVNLFLHLEKAEFMYIIHHILSLYIIDYISSLNLSEGLDYYIIMISLISELQNPILNLKLLIQDYPMLKTINKMILYYMYFICRIILFPIYSFAFLYKLNFDYKFTLFFICIYSMSFNWFLTMRKKFKMKY